MSDLEDAYQEFTASAEVLDILEEHDRQMDGYLRKKEVWQAVGVIAIETGYFLNTLTPYSVMSSYLRWRDQRAQ